MFCFSAGPLACPWCHEQAQETFRGGHEQSAWCNSSKERFELWNVEIVRCQKQDLWNVKLAHFTLAFWSIKNSRAQVKQWPSSKPAKHAFNSCTRCWDDMTFMSQLKVHVPVESGFLSEEGSAKTSDFSIFGWHLQLRMVRQLTTKQRCSNKHGVHGRCCQFVIVQLLWQFSCHCDDSSQRTVSVSYACSTLSSATTVAQCSCLLRCTTAGQQWDALQQLTLLFIGSPQQQNVTSSAVFAFDSFKLSN